MIDRVRMSQIVAIPEECLQSSAWHQRRSMQSGKVSYAHFYKNLLFKYYPDSQRLILDRRLVGASVSPDKVTNLDQLMAGISEVRVKQIYSKTDNQLTYQYEAQNQNFDELIAEINQHMSYLIDTEVNILYFKVTYIELCFNVTTPYVSQYIKLFNLMFGRRNPKNLTNFVLTMGKPLHGSYYTKSKSQFRQNKAYGLVTNFYNKKDQLLNRQREVIKKEQARYFARHKSKSGFVRGLSENVAKAASNFDVHDSDITVDDMMKAENTLRLEVKLHHKALYDRFGTEPRPFILFLDKKYCKDEVARIYYRMCGLKIANNHPIPKDLDNYDYYSLKKAIAVIGDSSLSPTMKYNLIKTVKSFSMNHKLSSSTSINNNEKREAAAIIRYKNSMRSLGMHWFLIPVRLKLDFLDSPIKLLEKQLEEMSEEKKAYLERTYYNKLEASFANNIDITEDEAVMIGDVEKIILTPEPDSSDPTPVSIRFKVGKKPD